MSLPRSNTVLENQAAENVKSLVNSNSIGTYITLTDNEGTYQKLITKEFVEQVNSKNFVPQITNADMAEHKLNIKNGYTMKVDNGRAYYVLDGKNRELVFDRDKHEYVDKINSEVATADLEIKKKEPGAPPVDYDAIRKKRLARYGKRRQGGVLRYPAELLTEHTDYLQIDIERYAEIGKSYISDTGGSSRYVIGNASQNRAGRTRKLSRRPLINAGTILLPIPAQLQDTNNVVYGDSKMNGLAAAGVSVLDQSMSKIGGQVASGQKLDISDEIDGFKDKLRTGLGENNQSALTTAADVLTKKLAAEAVNIFGANVTVNQLLARGSGEILNPNMELLFSDVTIRNFRFSFKLTPRNAREAEQVKLIIRAFKRNMAPQAQGGVSGSGNFFLRAPNVFKLRYRSGANDHPFLNKFKQCFLTDMQTTYTGDGVYSTYEDGTPVSMQLDLSFKELQPIYDIDYDSKPGDGAVGY